MAKKAKPVEVKVSGSQQVASLETVYAAKEEADKAKLAYDNARKGALPTILSKIFQHWKRKGAPHVGAYDFQLPDGTVKTANVQNRQSTKTYDPADAKTILGQLNATCEENAQLKPSDVYNVVVNHGIHPDAMSKPAIRERVVKALLDIEKDMKSEGKLPPEVSLVLETKRLVLADHALDRIVALTNDIDAAMQAIDNPVAANLVTPKPKS